MSRGILIEDRESVVITRPDGTQVRWADDEPGVENVPADLSYGTSAPGGFKGLSCNLARGLKATGREGLFDDVQVLGPGGAVRWEGRLQQMPASTDSGGRVTPQAVGWQAHLEDDATAREIYVDRDLANWGGRPLARQLQIRPGFNPFDGSTVWGQQNGTAIGPVLDLRIDSYAWSSGVGRPHIGMAYAAGGIPLGRVDLRTYGQENVGSAAWKFALEFFDVLDGGTSSGGFPTQSGGFPDGLHYVWDAPAGTLRIEPVLYYQDAPAGAPGAKYGLSLAEAAVYGRHGLPGIPSVSKFGGDGPLRFLASDVMANAISRWAPKLRFTTGPNGSIRPSDFPIPHLVFRDHTTTTEIVERCNAFHQWDWAVWENKTFSWGPRGDGRTWKIATADGLDLSLEGDTTDRISTGVVVTYTDYAGVQRSAGPPGSTAEVTDPQLLSTDPNNPAVAHGLRRWSILNLSIPSDPASAITIGRTWLVVQALASRRGQATVTGWVQDDASAMRPVSEVRAGDTLIVTDRPDDPPRRIIETNYSRGPRQNVLTLDSTAASLEAILERLGAELVGTV